MAASFSLTGSVRVVPNWTEPLDLVDVVDKTTVAETLSLADGTGNSQGNCYWRDTRTVAAGQTDTLNLASLPLNVYGGSNTLSIATLRLVYVKNKSATVSLSYGIAAAAFTITPGGIFLWVGGTSYANVPGTAAQEIAITNGGASAVDYEILLAGVKT